MERAWPGIMEDVQRFKELSRELESFEACSTFVDADYCFSACASIAEARHGFSQPAKPGSFRPRCRYPEAARQRIFDQIPQ